MSKLTTRALALALMVAAFSGSANAVLSTPEIDPGSMASGLTLLGAAMLLIGDKVRRSK